MYFILFYINIYCLWNDLSLDFVIAYEDTVSETDTERLHDLISEFCLDIHCLVVVENNQHFLLLEIIEHFL